MSGSGAGAPHHPEPLADTAYTRGGRRDGRLLDLRYLDVFPAEAHCSCGEMLRRESQAEPWEHTGRMPGEPG